MNVILCCGDTALRQRWLMALQPGYRIYQLDTLRALSQLVRNRIRLDLLFLHRTLVDQEVIGYIRHRQPDCRLFILSDHPDDEEGLHFLRQGVIGYANSYINRNRLQEAVRAVAADSVWIHHKLMQRLIAETTTHRTKDTAPAKSETGLDTLSGRENEIAALVAHGLSNLEIAARLGITERTVKAHLGAVYAKTATRGRLSLALLVKKTQEG